MESDKIELAKQLILKHFSFLIKKGYSIDVEIKNDELFSEYLTIRYKNKELKREIGICYAKAAIDKDTKYTFSADIVRMPYSGREDFFNLNIYLRSIGNDFPVTIGNQYNERQAEVIVGKITGALQTYASKIIDGTEWLGGYYPR